MFPVLLSLRVALISTVLVAVLAVPLARLMGRGQYRGTGVLEAIITLPLVLPPSVVGYALLIMLGKNGILGPLLNRMGIQIIFTWWAVVIAATVVAFPLMYQSAKGAFKSVDPVYEKAARTLGASEFRVFHSISIPLAWPGLISGVALTFARALGEFGATLMVAGNIAGKTQTIPLAIYFAVESGHEETANVLVAIITVVCFALILGVNRLGRRQIH